MTPGQWSRREKHVEAHGRPVARLTMVTEKAAGISGDRAGEILERAAKALGWAIERERESQ